MKNSLNLLMMSIKKKFILLFCLLGLVISALFIPNIPLLKSSEQHGSHKKKALFIINPRAGTLRNNQIEQQIRKKIDEKKFDYTIEYTKGPKDATRLSKLAANNDYDLVVAVGGDGTVNEVSKGLIGKKTSLGIIPSGSGNGLARHLNISLKPKEAIDLINHFHTHRIDTVKINDESYLCVAGVGFDARISSDFAKSDKRGLRSYLKVIINQLSEYKPQEYELIIDGKLIKTKAFLISFANSNQYGNNAYIAPHAIIDDGWLDVQILKEFPSHAAPKIAFDLFNKTIDSSEYLETIRCREVTLYSPMVEMHIDGEPMHFKDVIHINIQPSSLNVITPESKKTAA